MLFFLDSAKLDEIEYAIKRWKIDGVTTNPRHLANAHMRVEEFVDRIKPLVENTNISVSIEVNPHLNEAESMVEEAQRLASMCENFVIKIPATEAGFEALSVLSKKGVKVNVTLVFNVVQALQAARLGAYYISPFVGWKEERGDYDQNFISNVVKAVKNYGFKSKILIAAVRSARHFTEAALAGADIITASFEVYKRSFENPYSSLGLGIFKDSWDQIQK
ncbi:MAG: 6-deoxy-6-sulfo-D-fructose transaldolase [Pseudothermotoga sp.]|nr:6-deoxy-6-sulfo-D-fructose transaldolase [Pseudothermotoga sp.]